MATEADVARMAGVSQSTVSRVLNNHPHVRPEVRERVLQAVAVLQYQPNQVARSLVTQRTRTVGLVVADLRNPFFAEVAESVISACRGYGYQVLISTTGDQPDVQARAIAWLRSQQVEGLLIGSTPMADREVKALIDSGFPCVLFNRILHTHSGSYVALNNRLGAQMATEHLLNLGHRRIAVLTGPRYFSTFAHRLEGYAAALKARGVPRDRRLVVDYASFATDRQGVLRWLLALTPPPTALFALTDSYALEVLDVLDSMGVPVPEGLALVGFDDINLAGHSRIGLTTVAQNKHLMGRMAVETLMELIRARDEGRPAQPVHLLLEPQLVVRRTCGASRVGEQHRKG